MPDGAYESLGIVWSGHSREVQKGAPGYHARVLHE
jgi:hypothetical protein